MYSRTLDTKEFKNAFIKDKNENVYRINPDFMRIIAQELEKGNFQQITPHLYEQKMKKFIKERAKDSNKRKSKRFAAQVAKLKISKIVR